jgi:threonine 3-dehydrogenase
MSRGKKMRAIVKTKPEIGAEYLEVDVPVVGAGEVLVKVRACAICGTDIHIYQWNNWAAANVPRAYGGLPRIMGHEFCGDVVEVGPNVTKVKVGDRIAAETHIPCGQCFLCRTGKQFNCQNVRRFKNGVFAEYALIPEFSAEKIPHDIPYEVAALFEPFGVAVHGASHVRMVGDTVSVIGVGPIGIFCIVMAKIMGASTIFASDISDYRLSLAKIAGADYILNPNKEDVVSKIKGLTEGLGVGVVFETSGNVRGAKQGFEMLRKSGSYVMIGLPSEPLVLDAGSDIVWKGANVYGIHGRDNFTTWEIAKNLLTKNKIDLKHFVTHRFKFEEFKKAFDLCQIGETGKVILFPD